ncbi:MAG: CocE/NonD family hydrolase, partial [Chloroflexi bacterium]|nr:CocE/NonD family hydrolase [Chloroflexota bacterium]
DTDFTAKLVDVYPPNASYPEGFAMNVVDGIMRARFRNNREKAELMRPGTVYKFRIDLQGTANLFKKGHRIRLDISSSNYPHYDVNPNTGGPLWSAGQGWQLAHQEICHDAGNPSHVILPIIPKDRSTAKAAARPAAAARRTARTRR